MEWYCLPPITDITGLELSNLGQLTNKFKVNYKKVQKKIDIKLHTVQLTRTNKDGGGVEVRVNLVYTLAKHRI